MLPKVRKCGTFTRLPQLTGYWACDSLKFLDPTQKGRHYKVPSRQQAICRHEEILGAPFAGRDHAEQVQRDVLFTISECRPVVANLVVERCVHALGHALTFLQDS